MVADFASQTPVHCKIAMQFWKAFQIAVWVLKTTNTILILDYHTKAFDLLHREYYYRQFSISLIVEATNTLENLMAFKIVIVMKDSTSTSSLAFGTSFCHKSILEDEWIFCQKEKEIWKCQNFSSTSTISEMAFLNFSYRVCNGTFPVLTFKVVKVVHFLHWCFS